MAISGAMTRAEFELMLSDTGVPVVCGAVTTSGLRDDGDQVTEGEEGFRSMLGAGPQQRGEVIGKQMIVTVLTADFPAGALAIDSPITVGGVDYVIRLALSNS